MTTVPPKSGQFRIGSGFKRLFLLAAALVYLSTFAHSAPPQKWSSGPSDLGVSGEVDALPDGGYSFSVAGDQIESLSGQLLTTDFPNLTQFQVSRQAGMGGIIVMSEAGVTGSVLAVIWEKDDGLSFVYRSREGEPLRAFAMDKASKAALSLVKRGGMTYAYATDTDGSTPLVAVDFDFGKSPRVGVIGADGFACTAPQITAVPATLSLTADLDLDQPGTSLLGEWKKETSADSLNGQHLINDGTSKEALAAVQMNGILAGSHEFWIRHSAAEGRTTAEVRVEGFGETNAFSFNQQIAGGLWLSLGRYQVTSGVNATVSLKSVTPGSGTLSVDAIHYLWSGWADEDHDGVPDAWQTAIRASARSLGTTVDASASGQKFREKFKPDETSDTANAAASLPTASDRVVLFVNPTGDDGNDGKTRQADAGPWQGIRGGPKRTIKAALTAARGAKMIELQLDGTVQAPPEGFLKPDGASLIVLPGPNGAYVQPPVIPLKPPPPFVPLPGAEPVEGK